MGAVLLLLVLGGWVAVGAWWVTSHREGPTNAIGSFSRQLGSLQQRTPARFGPASRAPRTLPSHTAMRASASYHRVQTQRRRRDILSGLALLSALTLVLGFVPRLHVLWALHLMSDVALALYVMALMRLTAIATERDMQARFSGRPAPVRQAPARRMAAYEAYEGDEDYGYEGTPVLAPAYSRR